MIITDCIIEMGFEAIKSKAISCENEKKIKQRLKSFIEHQYQVNTNCTLEEEIDFSKLAYYIYTELPKDVDVCLFGEKRERKRAQDVIIKKAISYAQANTLLSNERTVNMVESAFKIIRDFFRLQINKELLFTASQIEDTIISEIEKHGVKQKEEMEGLLKKFEETILTNTTVSMSETSNLRCKREESLPHNLTKS